MHILFMELVIFSHYCAYLQWFVEWSRVAFKT